MRLPPAREVWVRGDSAHFTFYSNAGEARVRDLSRTLERLVDVLARTRGQRTSPVSTAVYVFRDDRSFAPYKRNPDGTVKNFAGFFVKGDVGNYVALDGAMDTPRIVLHEYLHQFTAYNFPPLPPWLDEGLAEFHSTFTASDRSADVGRPVAEHVAWLRQYPLIPLRRLFAVTHDAPEYNERARQGVFYAESWALVHLLTMGKPERRAQIGGVLDRLGSGQAPEQALAALGDLDALESELRSYVRQNAFAYATLEFEERKLEAGAVRFAPMARQETLFRLGDLLLRTSERKEDAAAHFRAALSLAPQHAGALGGLALLDLDAGRSEQAAAGFARAVALAPDDAELRLRLAQALYQTEYEKGGLAAGPEVPPRILQAREHAARAAALRPDRFDGHFLLGLTYGMQTTDLEPGIAALQRAHTLAPGRVDALLALGGLQYMAEHLADARATFEQALRGSSDAKEAAEARVGLAEVAISEALEEGSRTHDNAKAAASIRAVLPDLPPDRRGEVEALLGKVESIRPGIPFSDEGAPPPAMDSTDLRAHLAYASRQGAAADRAGGDEGVRLSKEALGHFRRATELDPTSGEAWIGWAMTCVRALCPTQEGMAAAEKAFALRPQDVWAAYLLANYRIDADEPSGAEPLLAPLLNVDHRLRDDIRYTLVRARVEQARALLEKGKSQEALRLLQVEAMPEGELGKDARERLEDARGRVQCADSRLFEAARARQAGKLDEAASILEDVLAHCASPDLVRMARNELARVRPAPQGK